MSGAPAQLAGLSSKGQLAPALTRTWCSSIRTRVWIVDPHALHHRHPLTPVRGHAAEGRRAADDAARRDSVPGRQGRRARPRKDDRFTIMSAITTHVLGRQQRTAGRQDPRPARNPGELGRGVAADRTRHHRRRRSAAIADAGWRAAAGRRLSAGVQHRAILRRRRSRCVLSRESSSNSKPPPARRTTTCRCC